MTRQVLQSALLSLSLSLSGCAVYAQESPRYFAARYSSHGYQQAGYPGVRSSNWAYPQPSYADSRSNYGYQQFGYPVVRYREYPQVQLYRYPARQPVYLYRQAPPRYWPAPAWQGYRDQGHHYRDYDRRDQREWYERHGRDGDQRRGWEMRRY
jgi:hypothetical protein